MKALLLSLFVLPLSALAAVDPQTDTRAREQLLSLPLVAQQIEWARSQEFNGSRFDEFRITTRATALPEGFDPSVFERHSHYLMFLSQDWKWLCQVSLFGLWRKEGDQFTLEPAHSGIEAKPVCFPRI